MSRNELNGYLAAILTTLAEVDIAYSIKGASESSLYIALGMDMERWEIVKGVLVGAQLVTIKSHYVQLTAKGQDMASKCNAALAKG